MVFSEIYKKVIEHWPDEIDISDGENVNWEEGSFRTLSGYWCNIEKYCSDKSDAVQLIVWAVYCGFHRLATVCFMNGGGSVQKTELDLHYIALRFEQSLFDTNNCYSEELLKIYQNDLL